MAGQDATYIRAGLYTIWPGKLIHMTGQVDTYGGAG